MESTTPAQTTEQTQTTRKPRNKPADPTTFGQIWNASNSRNEVVERLGTAGFPTSYSAVVARAKHLKEQGAHLKDMPAGARGRKTDIGALNAALDAPATTNAG